MLPWVLALTLAGATCASAAVTRLRLVDRSDVLDGRSFGSAGPYERILAKAHFAVDPKLAANGIITDISLAPRNDAGLVEFAADLYVLKPRDPAKGNGTLLFEVSNRGRKGMLGMFDRASGSLDPSTQAEFGDNFLLDRGFTLVWLGWQSDVPDDPGLMRLSTQVAKGVTGLVRAEFVFDRKETLASLADRNHAAYAVADPGDTSIQLTVRDHADSPRRTVPRDRWRFADATHVEMASGFEPGKLYEVVYRSKDAPLVGLGPAAVRDIIAFFKHDGSPFLLGDQPHFIKRAIGFGTSQSGRFLRTFLFYGFNADEKGRRVFDGVWAHVAGAGRGSFNHRFAQPSRDGHPFLNTFYPTDIFPFTDLDETDAETGATGGILSRAAKANVVPKIFYTNGSYEYWGRAASLIHTSPDGKNDAPLAPDTRVYFLAGTQHGANAAPTKHGTQNLANPADYRWPMRALLVAMQAWLAEGKQPPESQYPRIAKDELVPVAAMPFAKIPGFNTPTRPKLAWRADFGPDFATRGVLSIEPPKVGKPFSVLLPKVDEDNNETSGIRMPELRVPLATYTGWNLRDPSIGAPDELFSMVGSFIPFARTKAERRKTGDPRPSIEERYKDREDYLARAKAAAQELVRGGYLLDSDAAPVVEQCGKLWDRLR